MNKNYCKIHNKNYYDFCETCRLISELKISRAEVNTKLKKALSFIHQQFVKPWDQETDFVSPWYCNICGAKGKIGQTVEKLQHEKDCLLFGWRK